MEIITTPRTKKQKAVAAMNDFNLWMDKMCNIHRSNVSEMSKAYIKVYENYIK